MAAIGSRLGARAQPQLLQQRRRAGFSRVRGLASAKPTRSSHFSLVRVPDISTQATAEVQAGAQYEHILACVLDANPFLGEGSKSVISMAGKTAGPNDAKVTLLLIQEQGTVTPDPEKQKENLSWHLHDNGCRNYEFLTQETTQPASVLVGDKADEIEADLVIISSEAIHSKFVDANQLAEFVSCPLLLVP